MASPTEPDVLHTTAGDLALEEVQLSLHGRMWSLLHTGAVISREQELEFLRGESTTPRPCHFIRTCGASSSATWLRAASC